MHFHEIISEAQYLYHGTSVPHLMKILRANALRPANLRGGYNHGVSTSRSYAVAQNFGADDPEFPQYAAVLVLDKARLAQKFRIRAYDDIGDDSEQEESIIGTIRPLHQYLVSLNVANISEMLQDDAFKEYLTEWDGFPTLQSVEQALAKLAALSILNKVGAGRLLEH